MILSLFDNCCTLFSGRVEDSYKDEKTSKIPDQSKEKTSKFCCTPMSNVLEYKYNTTTEELKHTHLNTVLLLT